MCLSFPSLRRVGGVEATFHALLTSALDGGRCTQGVEAPVNHSLGVRVGLRAGLDNVVTR
jgi:predicted thioesterase